MVAAAEDVSVPFLTWCRPFRGCARPAAGSTIRPDGRDVVEAWEAVGVEGEAGAPGFVFVCPDPVSEEPCGDSGGEDRDGEWAGAGESDAEQAFEDDEGADESGGDGSECPDQ